MECIFLPLLTEKQDSLFKSNGFTLLHSEWPKLHRVLAVVSAIGLNRDHLKILLKDHILT